MGHARAALLAATRPRDAAGPLVQRDADQEDDHRPATPCKERCSRTMPSRRSCRLAVLAREPPCTDARRCSPAVGCSVQPLPTQSGRLIDHEDDPDILAADVLDEEVGFRSGRSSTRSSFRSSCARVLAGPGRRRLTLHVTGVSRREPGAGPDGARGGIGFLARGRSSSSSSCSARVDKVAASARRRGGSSGRSTRSPGDSARQDHRWLSTLPGVGPSDARRRSWRTLRKKVARLLAGARQHRRRRRRQAGWRGRCSTRRSRRFLRARHGAGRGARAARPVRAGRRRRSRRSRRCCTMSSSGRDDP